jgi:hypothetical protein
MGHSGRKRHRDGAAGLRQLDEAKILGTDRVFRMTESERQKVAECLRYIDEARRALESQHNPDNREIVRELRASADRIFELVNGLEQTEG